MISKVEELQLIARCVAFDDHRAFARLVEIYSPGLRRFVFNMTMGDASLTDDIAQETFIKAYTSINSFRGMARFKTWLYTIACREYATHRRRRHEDLPDELPQIADPTADHQSHSEMSHDIEKAMTRLNETERICVLLFYLEDRPIKEVSRIAGFPEGTVKAALSRAKQKMATFLKD